MEVWILLTGGYTKECSYERTKAAKDQPQVLGGLLTCFLEPVCQADGLRPSGCSLRTSASAHWKCPAYVAKALSMVVAKSSKIAFTGGTVIWDLVLQQLSIQIFSGVHRVPFLTWPTSQWLHQVCGDWMIPSTRPLRCWLMVKPLPAAGKLSDIATLEPWHLTSSFLQSLNFQTLCIAIYSVKSISSCIDFITVIMTPKRVSSKFLCSAHCGQCTDPISSNPL